MAAIGTCRCSAGSNLEIELSLDSSNSVVSLPLSIRSSGDPGTSSLLHTSHSPCRLSPPVLVWVRSHVKHLLVEQEAQCQVRMGTASVASSP